MSALRVVRAEQYRRMPWRNGGGVTTEIARQDGADGELDWRVSIADVASDGPFSSFPGCDRAITVLEGAGMVLRHAGGDAIEVGPLAIHTFEGDVATECALLAGPVRDFNLITRRSRVRGTLAALQVGAEPVALDADVALVHCVRGCVRLVAGDEDATLAEGESALLDGVPPRGRVVATSGEATLLVVALRSSP